MVAQTVKNPPAMQETWVQSLGREDPLEKAWQPTAVFSPGEFRGQRSLAGYSPRGHRVGHDCATNAQCFVAKQLGLKKKGERKGGRERGRLGG